MTAMQITARTGSALQEAIRRKNDALELFRPRSDPDPMQSQEALCLDKARQIGIFGGNQCLPGWQEIYDPVLEKSRRIDQISGPFHVVSFDPETGERVAVAASEPFMKGVDDFYEVELTNGQKFTATKSHRVLCDDYRWRSIADVLQLHGDASCRLLSTLDTAPLSSLQDARRCSRTVQGSTDRCCLDCCPCGEQLLSAGAAGQGSAPSQSDAQERINCDSLHGGWASSIECSHLSLQSDHPSSPGVLGLTSDRAVASGIRSSLQPCSPAFADAQGDQQFAGASVRPPRTTHAFGRQATPEFVAALCPTCGRDTEQIEDGFRVRVPSRQYFYLPSTVSESSPQEQVRRDVRQPFHVSVGIESVRWVGRDIVWDCHVVTTNNYELAGIFHHNSGKSLIAAAIFASIARDKPITFSDGRKIEMRLPHQKGRPLLMWCIGIDLKHIGQTIYQMLFKPGAFRIIRDRKTGMMRAWNPLDPDDKSRESETEPSPPFIPEYRIEQQAWSNKASGQFDIFVLDNGTRICGMSSMQNVKQGDRVDVIWIDEQIDNPKHYDEWLMRIMTNKGRIFWTSWPTEAANEALQNLYDAAERFAGTENPPVTRYCFQASKNPYIPTESREEIMGSGMLSEDVLLARDKGLFLTDTRRIYPLFSKKTHRLLPEDSERDDKLAAEIRKCGDIPPDWTHYLILDPGTNHPALLDVVVPPPEFGDFVIASEELYPGRKDADQLAALAKARWGGRVWEKWWIDANAERQQTMSFSITVGDNYERAFAKCGLKCRATGSNFTPASNNVLGGIELVRSWLSIREDGTAKLRVWVERCPNLTSQLIQYRKKIMPNGSVSEDPDPYQRSDLCDCLRYCATRKPKYVKRDLTPTYASEFEHLAALFPRNKQQGDFVNCGPGTV